MSPLTMSALPMVPVKWKEVAILNSIHYVDFIIQKERMIFNGQSIVVRPFHGIPGKSNVTLPMSSHRILLFEDQVLIIHWERVPVTMCILNRRIHKNMEIKHGLLVKFSNHPWALV